MGQKRAMDENIGPYTYNAGRFVVSTFYLFTIRPWMQSLIESNISLHKDYGATLVNRIVDRARHIFPMELSSASFHLFFWSVLNGIGLFLANELLQVGLVTTAAGKSAFIVGLYVVFIPAFEQMWSISSDFCWQTWAAAGMCLVGLFFMSGCVDAMVSDVGESCSDAVGMGDVLVFAGMLAFSATFMISDTAAKRVDCIDLTCWSFLVATVLCIGVAVVLESRVWSTWPPLRVVRHSWDMVLLVGVSEASAMGLGTLGQMYTPASRAALLTSLEASVSAFFAYLFLGEVLSYYELFGCFLMLSATLVSTAVLDDDLDNDDESDGDEDIPDDGSMASIRRKKARNVRRRRRHFKNVYKRRTRSFSSVRETRRRASSFSELENTHGGGLAGADHQSDCDTVPLIRSVSDSMLCTAGINATASDVEDGSVVHVVLSYVQDGLDKVLGLSDARSPFSKTQRGAPDVASDISSSPESHHIWDEEYIPDIPLFVGHRSNRSRGGSEAEVGELTTSKSSEYSHLLEIPEYSPRSRSQSETRYGTL